MKTVGELISSHRHKKKLTQRELATIMQRSHALVNQWEHNTRDPSTKDFIKLVVKLDIKMKKIKQCFKE